MWLGDGSVEREALERLVVDRIGEGVIEAERCAVLLVDSEGDMDDVPDSDFEALGDSDDEAVSVFEALSEALPLSEADDARLIDSDADFDAKVDAVPGPAELLIALVCKEEGDASEEMD